MYFYSFDVFRAAGIQEDHLPYTALGTGLCELSTSLTCVGLFSLMIYTHFMIYSLLICTCVTINCSWKGSLIFHLHFCVTFLWKNERLELPLVAKRWTCVLILQFMIIENTGKKALFFRGYMGMSATLVLLTITLYFQVSPCETQIWSAAYFCMFWCFKHDTGWLTAAVIAPVSHRVSSLCCHTAAWSSSLSSSPFFPVDQVRLSCQIK